MRMLCDGCSLSVCCNIEPIYGLRCLNVLWFHLCLSRDLPSSVSGAGRCGVSVIWIGAPHMDIRNEGTSSCLTRPITGSVVSAVYTAQE